MPKVKSKCSNDLETPIRKLIFTMFYRKCSISKTTFRSKNWGNLVELNFLNFCVIQPNRCHFKIIF